MLASNHGVSPASLLSLQPAFRWVSRAPFSDIPEMPSPKLIRNAPSFALVSVDKSTSRHPCRGLFATVQLTAADSDRR